MTLRIRFIPKLNSTNLQNASEELYKLNPEYVSNNNWSDQFPETPEVMFRIAHNNKEIFVRFDVKEKYTLAKYGEDQGEIWTDSACEFFISFDKVNYYNIEMNCIGKALMGYKKQGEELVYGKTDLLKRLASLGSDTFEERIGNNQWTLTYCVPIEAFWNHNIKELHCLKVRCNFYKCGDNLTKPHFLSWKPINTPTPNFHVPEFFGDAEFE